MEPDKGLQYGKGIGDRRVARPYAMVQPDGYEKPYRTEPELADRKGGDMAEWPEDLRVREFPI